MSEAIEGSLGAGARISTARRNRGLALDVLATQLKVPVARLEALERERWNELPDPTHARALATSVCRALEIDPAPVLAAMPRGAGAALERVTQGLNQPVRSGNGLALPRSVWIGLLLLALAAGALLVWPTLSDLLPPRAATPAPETAVQPLPEPAMATAPVAAAASELASAPAPASAPIAQAASAVAPAASTSVAVAPAVVAASAMLEIRAVDGPSWVSVSDAAGNSLAAQLLNPGESLSLNPQAALPLRVVLGNAPVLALRWRGQAQALDGYEQRRVAKLELK